MLYNNVYATNAVIALEAQTTKKKEAA